MVNYANGKIYKIVNDVDDKIYVGSTVRRLCDRWFAHRKPSRRQASLKLYQHMAQLGVEHFRIELLEDYPCERKEQLNAREGHWIRELRAELNTVIPGRSMEEWLEDNKEQLREKVKTTNREQYLKNREARLEYRKKYYEANRERILQNEKDRYARKRLQDDLDMLARIIEEAPCSCGERFVENATSPEHR